MDAIKINSRREVCWDEALIETAENVRVEMHKPEYRNDALVCDTPWEGNSSGFFTVIPDGTHFRLYYRGCYLDVDEFGKADQNTAGVLCYAQSADGKTFQRVNLKLHEYWGTLDNNILSLSTGDNIAIFKDTNPACPEHERFKGLCGGWVGENDEKRRCLWLYTSADGVHFEKNRVLTDDGAYDSLNISFWDDHTQQYYLFYRGWHGERTNGNRPNAWVETKKGEEDEEAVMARLHHKGRVRDVRVRTSKDFVTWDPPQQLLYGDKDPDIELYTNNVQQYYRADHMMIGFPMRYIDRYMDTVGFSQLPDWKHRQELIRKWGRQGTAMTDAAIMTSRDGLHFRRTEEAFLTAGIERGTNWYYGDGLMCYGMAETASDIPGAPNEISLYTGVNYRVGPLILRRYAIRLDGFFSWRCDYQPGKVVTKPFVFQGDQLSINFSTSAFGGVRIRILDADGEAIEGYDSGVHFGDSVDRKVPFAKPLKELNGKEVRLEITMRDADLYSFKFTPDVRIC